MLTALILEDHKETRQFLLKLVQEVFPDCAIQTAENIHQAMHAISQQSFCLAIVDLSLPDGNGLQVIRHIRSTQQQCYVVVATIFDDESHVLDALKAGAMGYLLKDNPRPFLLNALRGISSGLPPVSASITRQMMRALTEQSGKRRRNTDIQIEPKTGIQEIELHRHRKEDETPFLNGSNLSSREKEVLRLMAKGFNRAEIAGYLEITANTSASHIKSIYRKLCIGSRAEAALLASKMGIV
ncbi:response regulator [Undibacterium fentianense]|uniref:Response regulator transcription factor n=1 Tax=Undibacterium fentianense TaxID=2828728 RepID=A0A941IFE8_9BURK|nr:response regulator transcription factor [Undibacterium fentianense]MBR7800641.1 response regulator transcription factor [Undibacterium fentianense]